TGTYVMSRLGLMHHVGWLMLSSHAGGIGEVAYYHWDVRLVGEPLLTALRIPHCVIKNRRGKYFDPGGPGYSGGSEGFRCRFTTASHFVGGSCMTHFEAVEVIASRLTNQIVISNVGNTNRELYSVKKHKLTLYGVNMSLVTPLAFGLAKAIPQRKVIALDGDGSILMGLKTLATAGTHPAKNLLVLVLDNGCYAACGWYPTATGRGVDLAGIATPTGFPNVKVVNQPGDLSK